MRTRLWPAAFALAVVTAFVVLPLAASADNERTLVIGVRYNLNPGPPLTGAGTWSECCALNDSGATHAVVHVMSVKNDFARISGTHTFESAKGTFTDAYTGTLGPLSSPRQVARGDFDIVNGTGAYTDLRGSGEFTVEVDGPTLTATGIHEGEVGSDR